MIEKKRSEGVKLFGIIYIILGAFDLFMILTPNAANIFVNVIVLLQAILFIIGAVLLMRLSIWGCWLTILPLLFVIIAFPPLIVLLIVHIVFFTRPKVKEQFR